MGYQPIFVHVQSIQHYQSIQVSNLELAYSNTHQAWEMEHCLYREPAQRDSEVMWSFF